MRSHTVDGKCSKDFITRVRANIEFHIYFTKATDSEKWRIAAGKSVFENTTVVPLQNGTQLALAADAEVPFKGAPDVFSAVCITKCTP